MEGVFLFEAEMFEEMPCFLMPIECSYLLKSVIYNSEMNCAKLDPFLLYENIHLISI